MAAVKAAVGWALAEVELVEAGKEAAEWEVGASVEVATAGVASEEVGLVVAVKVEAVKGVVDGALAGGA